MSECKTLASDIQLIHVLALVVEQILERLEFVIATGSPSCSMAKTPDSRGRSESGSEFGFRSSNKESVLHVAGAVSSM